MVSHGTRLKQCIKNRIHLHPLYGVPAYILYSILYLYIIIHVDIEMDTTTIMQYQ